jgi:hypothetical protein
MSPGIPTVRLRCRLFLVKQTGSTREVFFFVSVTVLVIFEITAVQSEIFTVNRKRNDHATTYFQ